MPESPEAIEHATEALHKEVARRNEYYGLDNWGFKEVVSFVLDSIDDYHKKGDA